MRPGPEGPAAEVAVVGEHGLDRRVPEDRVVDPGAHPFDLVLGVDRPGVAVLPADGEAHLRAVGGRCRGRGVGQRRLHEAVRRRPEDPSPVLRPPRARPAPWAPRRPRPRRVRRGSRRTRRRRVGPGVVRPAPDARGQDRPSGVEVRSRPARPGRADDHRAVGTDIELRPRQRRARRLPELEPLARARDLEAAQSGHPECRGRAFERAGARATGRGDGKHDRADDEVMEASHESRPARDVRRNGEPAYSRNRLCQLIRRSSDPSRGRVWDR